MGEDSRQGFERISSAPRLSFSTQDVFNLRNHNLSQLSRSSPGIYGNENHVLNLGQHKLICNSTSSMPKSILVKPKEDAIPECNTDEEREDPKLPNSLRLEVQVIAAFVLFAFFLIVVIPISMVVMGSIYLYSCPAEVMIPIFLIVGGAFFLFAIGLLKKLHRLAKKSDEDRNCYRKTFIFAVMFQIGWFIAGCYWTYGIYEPAYNEENALYCHKTLYLYCFWFLNAIFLTLSLFAVLFAIYILFARNQTTDIGTKV